MKLGLTTSMVIYLLNFLENGVLNVDKEIKDFLMEYKEEIKDLILFMIETGSDIKEEQKKPLHNLYKEIEKI